MVQAPADVSMLAPKSRRVMLAPVLVVFLAFLFGGRFRWLPVDGPGGVAGQGAALLAPPSGERVRGSRVTWSRSEGEFQADACGSELWRLRRQSEMIQDLAHDDSVADQSDQLSSSAAVRTFDNVCGENSQEKLRPCRPGWALVARW